MSLLDSFPLATEAQRSCRVPLPWWLRSHPTIWYGAHHRHVWRRAMLRSLLASARTSTRSIAFIVSTSAVQLRLATMRIVRQGGRITAAVLGLTGGVISRAASWFIA